MNPNRSGVVVVAMIILLLIIDLVVVGLVVSGSRDHDLTVKRLGNIRAFYAAEAGMNMAIREVLIDADEDGDCRIGSISHDGDSGNDPGFTASSFVVAGTSSGCSTTIDSYGSSGEARARLVVVLPSGGSVVTLQETITATQPGCCSPLVTGNIGAGSDQTYLLFVATRRNNDVISVTGGGLTWTERVEQCAGREEQGIRLWTAEGSPASSFQVTINWDDADPRPVVAILHRYCGVSALEDLTGENTNGEAGGCAGGIDSTSVQLTLTSTVNASVHVIGLNHRNETVLSYSAEYTETGTDQSGSGGELTSMTTYERLFNPAATDQFQATISNADDWCTAGIVLKP